MGNLTPRGLETPIYSSEINSCQSKLDESKDLFEYSLYVWSGVEIDNIHKALTISKALRLENKLSKNKENLLEVQNSFITIVLY